MVVAGELPDPLPPQIEELARAYFEVCPPGRQGVSAGQGSARLTQSVYL